MTAGRRGRRPLRRKRDIWLKPCDIMRLGALRYMPAACDMFALQTRYRPSADDTSSVTHGIAARDSFPSRGSLLVGCRTLSLPLGGEGGGEADG